MARGGDGFGVLLEGDKRLGRKLRKLPWAVQSKVMRPAVSGALSPINKAAKQKCRKDTGLLKKSIGTKTKVYNATKTVWGAVGPRTDEKYTGVGPDGRRRVPNNYAHLVELGTDHSPAYPFLRPALDEQRPAAMQRLRQRAWDGIEKEAAKR